VKNVGNIPSEEPGVIGNHDVVVGNYYKKTNSRYRILFTFLHEYISILYH